jgi:hypothetical protein
MMTTTTRCALSLTLVLGIAGCSQSASTGDSAQGGADATYLLAEKPSDAVGVADARKDSADEVTIEGRIGGSTEPFIKGVAAFTIVDNALAPCGAAEGCPTPWDYCCVTNQLKTNMAVIKIVDASGSPVSKDARELLGVKELSKVVVRGKAQRDDSGNLTVLATKLHLVKE